jgi:PadR family transcriptional regulator PadR
MNKSPSTAPPDRQVEAPILLGRFENSLLRAIKILGMDAYGAELGRFLSNELHREVTAPQVYMTLERLAKRGLVRFENTDPVHARGGRSRKRFIIEATGARALNYTAASVNAIANPEEVEDVEENWCPA